MDLLTFQTHLKENNNYSAFSNDEDLLIVQFSERLQKFVIELNAKIIDSKKSLKSISEKAINFINSRKLEFDPKY